MSKTCIADAGNRIQLLCLSGLDDGLVVSLHEIQVEGIVDAGEGGTRSQFDSSLEFSLRSLPVPVIESMNGCL